MSTCVKHMFMTTYVEHILPGNCLSQAWLKIFTKSNGRDCMTQVILSSIVQMLILGNHLSNRSEIPILDAIYVKSVNCKICNLPERKQNFVMRLASFV